eukprot:207235_1
MNKDIIGVKEVYLHLEDESCCTYVALWTGKEESESHIDYKKNKNDTIEVTRKEEGLATISSLWKKGQSGARKCPVNGCPARYNIDQMSEHCWSDGSHGYSIGRVDCPYCFKLKQTKKYKNNKQLKCEFAALPKYKPHCKTLKHCE